MVAELYSHLKLHYLNNVLCYYLCFIWVWSLVRINAAIVKLLSVSNGE